LVMTVNSGKMDDSIEMLFGGGGSAGKHAIHYLDVL